MSRRSWRSGYSYYQEYVPVAERRAKAMMEIDKRSKNGEKLQPVVIDGRLIARSTWGRGWCEHLEKFHDYFNRLQRGRTYVRNGSVFHLEINPGEIKAMVSGSRIYNVRITIQPLTPERWQAIVKQCSGAIASWLDLLAGRFSDGIMAILADPDHGLFPGKKDISMQCSCPDGAVMCKHVAAVLYGVGNRLDNEPQMLFKLRQVDAADLFSATMQADTLTGAGKSDGSALVEKEDESFAELFGIDLDMTPGKSDRQKSDSRSVEKNLKESGKDQALPKPAPAPVKRGRGRPPKSAEEKKPVDVKKTKSAKKPGRSKKNDFMIVKRNANAGHGIFKSQYSKISSTGYFKKTLLGQIPSDHAS